MAADDTLAQLNATFEAFRENLAELLRNEAQDKVDSAVARLAGGGGAFRVEGAEVVVTIRELRVASADATSPVASGASARQPAKRSARRRSRSPSGGKKRGVGRPRGRLRTALLDAFEAPGQERDTDALRAAVGAAGIRATNANLHQHLSRLVQSGELSRAGRGIYRRERTAEAA